MDLEAPLRQVELEVGSYSAIFLDREKRQEWSEVLKRGEDPIDAALRLIHPHIFDHRELHNDFITHFVRTVEAMSSPELRPYVRQCVDSDDIQQSVFGDLVAKLSKKEYRSRREFISMIRQMLNNKAIDKARREMARPKVALPHSQASVAMGNRATNSITPEMLKILQRSELEITLAAIRSMPKENRRLLHSAMGTPWANVLKRRLVEIYGAANYRKKLQRARERFMRQFPNIEL